MTNAPATPDRPDHRGRSTAVVGLQWGDEGKGKIVDLLAHDHDAVVRYNGGANAGHSVVVAGQRYALHLVPSGILYPGKLAVIGNGVVVDPEALLHELDSLAARGVDTSGLIISDRAHVVAPYHKQEDELRESTLRSAAGPAASGGELGTTKRGIGPCYADKALRGGALRVGDLLKPALLRHKLAIALRFKAPLLGDTADPADLADRLAALGERLRPMVRDTAWELNGLIARGRAILFEGGNGTLLDVDHGSYPFVTSSSCAALGIGPGTGVPPQRIGRVLGVMKAYTTRVGRGPFPTELHDARGDRIREVGREFGTTTGRPRRVGWLDLVALRYSAMINGATGLALTMLDVLAASDEVYVCDRYEVDGRTTDRFTPDGDDLSRARPVLTRVEPFRADLARLRRRRDLPAAAARYLDRVESAAGVPIEIISVGPDRAETILE